MRSCEAEPATVKSESGGFLNLRDLLLGATLKNNALITSNNNANYMQKTARQEGWRAEDYPQRTLYGKQRVPQIQYKLLD